MPSLHLPLAAWSDDKVPAWLTGRASKVWPIPSRVDKNGKWAVSCQWLPRHARKEKIWFKSTCQAYPPSHLNQRRLITTRPLQIGERPLRMRKGLA